MYSVANKIIYIYIYITEVNYVCEYVTDFGWMRYSLYNVNLIIHKII